MEDIESEQIVEVRVIKKSDDPLGFTRLSLGGSEEMGYYCVYRGSKEQAITCLKAATVAMHMLTKQLGPDHEPDISPDDGKRFS